MARSKPDCEEGVFHVAVRNTFIEVSVEDEMEDEDEPLFRSSSEPAKPVTKEASAAQVTLGPMKTIHDGPAEGQGSDDSRSDHEIPGTPEIHEIESAPPADPMFEVLLAELTKRPSETGRKGCMLTAPTHGASQMAPYTSPAAAIVPLVPVIPPRAAGAISVIPPGVTVAEQGYPASNATISGKGRSAKGGKGKGRGKGYGGWREEKKADTQVLQIAATNVFHHPAAPPIGDLHHFHPETAKMGFMSKDGRQFTKDAFDGRLSVVTENVVHTSGRLRYAVKFTQGELSSADGVGFIFGTKLPAPKNIQKIVSIFANSAGRICLRARSEVVRSNTTIKRPELGDIVELSLDLDESTAEFIVWPKAGGAPSAAQLLFGDALNSLRQAFPEIPKSNSGYLAMVVKHSGTSLELVS